MLKMIVKQVNRCPRVLVGVIKVKDI